MSQALVKEFPDEDSWNKVRSSEEFITDLNAFSELLQDLKAKTLAQDVNEDFILNNYDLVLDSIENFASKYHIPIEDLVYVLIHG